jgi:hypothetical protein
VPANFLNQLLNYKATSGGGPRPDSHRNPLRSIPCRWKSFWRLQNDVKPVTEFGLPASRNAPLWQSISH